MLTKGVDTLTGTAKDDKFVAGDLTDAGGTSTTFTVGDNINGGAGTDVLEWIQSAKIDALPIASKISNVEYINATSSLAIELDTTGSNITGLEKLTTTNKGADQTLIASATQDVDATIEGNAKASVTGGKNVKVTSKDNALNTSDVTVKNAAGTVTTVINDGYAGTTATNALGNTVITGGTKINASSKVEFTAAQITAASTIAIAAQDTVVQGNVTVTGNASTTEVTVNQTAAQAKVGYEAASATNVKVDGKIGITNGDVTIKDANQASTTAAGTITTVTANSFKNLVVESGALTTLNLSGTGTSVDADDLGSLTTAANTALALNIDGLTTTGAVVIDTDIKTLNITSSNNASTIANLDADGATTVNVAGNAKATFTANTALAAVKDIVVTNTAGASFGTAIAKTVNFTGGAGDDAVVLSDAFEKAITMGAGNDTVTYGGAASIATGKLGSVNAGDGEDTIVMINDSAVAADNNSVFNSSFSGFEVLQLSDLLKSTANIDLDGINGVSKVILTGNNATGGQLSNLVSGGTVTLKGVSTGFIVNVKSAVAAATDVLNISLENSTASTVAYGSITAANVETINITTVDTGKIGTDGKNVLATQDSATLEATSATKIVVTGNNGLDLTNSGNTKVTTFDASAVAGDNVEDTAVALGVVYESATTVLANTADTVVTIIGGAGNDTLTGNTTIDTITGGAGNDTLTGLAGADIINVGEGRDAIIINSTNATGLVSTDSGTASFDTINGFKLASAFTSATGTDISTFAKFQGETVGGANASVLGIDMTNAAGTTQAITVEGPATGAGQNIGVNYVIKDGILTLGGTGASSVDTLSEWLTEADAVAKTDGDILAFQFGSDTYVFGQNGDADVFVKLAGVTGVAALAGGTGTSNGVDNTLWFVDIA